MAPVSRRTVLAALAAVPALAAVGCAGGGTAPPAGAGGRTPVRFAMDWTPNTNHTGLYAAQQQGWFADAGLDVQILPYNSTSTDCSPLRLIAHVSFTQRLVCEVHAVARTRGSSRSGARRRMSGILANSRGTHSDASTSIPVRKTRIIAADPREPTIRG